MNPLRRLQELGQSAWYDNIERGLLKSGELARKIDEDGLRGVTSNPTIFEKAINGSRDYDASLARLAEGPHNARDAFFSVAIEDIQVGADLLRPVYDASEGHDGMISLEVSPDLAYDSDGTVAEALRLWERVDRPNLMIKVPATREGVTAFEHLIAHGVNVNVTLLFSVERYKDVVEAYLAGLATRLRRGQPIDRIAAVASFFVSRVDSLIDKWLDQHAATSGLQGHIAIANAKLAYAWYQEIYAGSRFDELRAAGARPQRLLWASTGTKNPAYSDVLYIETLIGPDTVNTLPPATYVAFKDHGKPAVTLTTGLDQAHQHMTTLAQLGFDLRAATDQLEQEGVESFAKSFTTLLGAIDTKMAALRNGQRATG